MIKHNQSGDKSILRLDEISTILLDTMLVELLVVCQNTSSNTQDRSQSVKLGSNMNELDPAILQNPPAGYENHVGFEENGIKIVIAYYTLKNKALGFMKQGLIFLVYNSKVAFYSLIGTIRFLLHTKSILVTALIVRGPGF